MRLQCSGGVIRVLAVNDSRKTHSGQPPGDFVGQVRRDSGFTKVKVARPIPDISAGRSFLGLDLTQLVTSLLTRREMCVASAACCRACADISAHNRGDFVTQRIRGESSGNCGLRIRPSNDHRSIPALGCQRSAISGCNSRVAQGPARASDTTRTRHAAWYGHHRCGQHLFVAQSAQRRKVIWPLSSGTQRV